MTAKQLSEIFRDLADPVIAEHSQRFFKTGVGEYGEGDRFLGIRVPVIRTKVKAFRHLSLEEIAKLLASPFHEERLFALLLMVEQYSSSDSAAKDAIVQLYLTNTECVNNWDLVDSSAHYILGAHLEHRDRKLLYRLAKSSVLWERRIAIMSCFYFIRKHQFEDALAISELLIDDREDLIHKAVGWMLRELGKRDVVLEKQFLVRLYRRMPRTMLRYAIEKFPESERQRFLKGLA